MTKPHAQAKSDSARPARSANQEDILPLEQMMAPEVSSNPETDTQSEHQQVSNDSMDNVFEPALRFEGFTEPWSQHVLGELGQVISGIAFPEMVQGGSEGIPFFKVSDMNLDGNEFIMCSANNYVTLDDIKLHNWRPIDGPAIFFAKVGAAIFLNRKRLVLSKFLLDNNTMAYIINTELLDRYFAFVMFGLLNLPSLVQNGALPSYGAKDVSSMLVKIPPLPEQKRIGALFKELDRNLSLNRAQLEKLTQLKTSMLEQMFPKEGEDVPRLRFDGFTEPWQPTLLKDAVTSLDYGLNAPAKPFDFSHKFIHIQDIDADSRKISQFNITSPDVEDTKLSSYKAQYGDVFFARSGATVGRTYLYQPSDGSVIFACHFIRGKVKKGYFNPNFIFYNTLTNNFKSFIKNTSLRSAIPGVNAQEYGSYQFMAPSLAEQERIGAFFLALDERLALQRAKIEKLEQLKKALLEQMFV